MGRVYLVGAGPGDTGLITYKGYELLEKADVVIYDRLVNKELLDICREDAKLIYVGKSSKNHSKKQGEINEIIYLEALENDLVVRLKGGDPYVFGRGGEEAAYLRERGISFEEVPGVTSAIGGLAYAGIPITHRNIATSFHVITGHQMEGGDEPNWEALAKLKGTLVFLMSVSNLELISKKLLEYGKDPKTKAAIVNWASTPRQRVLEGTLEDIYEKSQINEIKPPSLIVFGEVVGLRKDLEFYESRPLFGKNIVITREQKRAKSTIDRFKDLGANVVSFPTIRTVKINDSLLEREILSLSDYSYLVFTSVNGVEIFFDKLGDMGLDGRALGSTKIAVIGKKTRDAVRSYGLKPDLMPDKFVAESLIDLMKGQLKKDDRILIPRAKIGRLKLVDELSDLCQVVDLHIYDTVEEGDETVTPILQKMKDYYLVFTSSSTFSNFESILGDLKDEILSRGKLISIGPITSQTIEKSGYRVYREAREYTIDGIVDILLEGEKQDV